MQRVFRATPKNLRGGQTTANARFYPAVLRYFGVQALWMHLVEAVIWVCAGVRRSWLQSVHLRKP